MLQKKYFTYFFILISVVGFAQQNIPWLHGNIILDPDGEVAEGVYVTNLRTKQMVISNFAGNFSIQANTDDVLEFKSDYYENRKIKITQEIFDKSKFVVHLNIDVIELQEALISANLTGILTKDVTAGKRHDDITLLYKKLGVNPDINPTKDTSALKAGFLGGDISLTRLDVGRIFDALSGDLRRRKSTMEYETNSDKYTSIRKYFGDDYFTNDLKIPKHKINNFIQYTFTTSGMDRDFENRNFLRIMETMNRYSQLYRNLFKPEELFNQKK